MSPLLENGSVLQELRTMVEKEQIETAPCIRLMLTSHIRILMCLSEIKTEQDKGARATAVMVEAVDTLKTKQDSGDKMARIIGVVAGLLSIGFMVMGFLHVF